MKAIRILVIVAAVLMMGAGSLHATPFGCDPFPRKPQKPQSPSVVVAVDGATNHLVR